MSIFEIQQMKNLSTQQEEGHDLASDDLSEEAGMHYGNLIVFAKSVHLSLGPDYVFTIIAIIFLSIISYALYRFQGMLSFGIVGKIISLIFVFTPPISFIVTALKNPGVYNCYENDEPKISYCEICKVFKPKRVFHCNRCNICIEGYDHHCPWLSKCVGKKNIKCFYVFILSLPSAFFYFGYLIYTAMNGQHAA